ncbi:N-acetylmuramoyl-L-alanine amidase [Massilia sp. DWR3-1-1]|uniref:N-acetylmuramoyl-L-alanine amidase n=1 Tax=Massilia sp. DWR3-1-1 TaxID=2804559 RepID=UPI003CFAEF3A
MKILLKPALTLLTLAALAGCATTPPGPRIDTSLSAKAQSSRAKFIIVHYTVTDLPGSIRALTQQGVSSHYLLTNEAEPVTYRLVDETRQANHAGVSNWKNFTLLNGSSIGIEIVNPGFTVDANGVRTWYPFPQKQIDALIVLLKDIVARHNIAPENILGHSDIAPGRKQDPGPMFPWFQLAQAGLIGWPDGARVTALKPVYLAQLPDAVWFQKKLAQFGYATPQTGQFDPATRDVLISFQMKYRPAFIDGTPDAETAALLEVLTTPAPALAKAP